MKTSVALLFCCCAGTTLAYHVQREWPDAFGRNDFFGVEIGPAPSGEPSQRMLWGNGGSNQVGGNDWWSTITDKFPFLRNKFGRLQAASAAPNGLAAQVRRQGAGRDVGLTDDAVIISPPNVPVAPQPPQPSPGYHYDAPPLRWQLPRL